MQSSTANHPQDIGDAINVIDSTIASTVFASVVTIHWALRVSPGGLAFQHDMLHPIPIVVNFELICQWGQTLINYDAAARDNCMNLMMKFY
jgi:hypothetical protein